jgi:hypothetical protein
MKAYFDGQLSSAQSRLAQALLKDVVLEDAWQGLALVARAQGYPRFAKAERGFQQELDAKDAAIAQAPQDVRALVARAGVFERRAHRRRQFGLDPGADRRAAHADLDRALAVDSSSAVALSEKAELLGALEGTELPELEAIEVLKQAHALVDRAIALGPQEARPWSTRGRLHAAHGELLRSRGRDAGAAFEAAETAFSTAIDKGFRWDLYRRATVRIARARELAARGASVEAIFSSAAADLDEALTAPNARPSYVMRTRGLLERARAAVPSTPPERALQHLARAEANLSSAIALDGTGPEARLQRGMVRREQGLLLQRLGRQSEAKRAHALSLLDLLQAYALSPRSMRVVEGGLLRDAIRSAGDLGELSLNPLP